MNNLDNKTTIASVKILPIAAVILAVIGSGFLATKYFVLSHSNSSSIKANANSTVSHTYTSSKLGVQFFYADQDLGKKILVQESDDKIFVYPEGIKPEEGQFVQVFTKDANSSLQREIEKKFLHGYKPADCFTISWVTELGSKPTTGITAVINFPRDRTDAVTPWWDNGKECPPNYSLSNGLAYFWTDKENSSKFVFFSIGQYYIPATTVGTSWHTTLKFAP